MHVLYHTWDAVGNRIRLTCKAQRLSFSGHMFLQVDQIIIARLRCLLKHKLRTQLNGEGCRVAFCILLFFLMLLLLLGAMLEKGAMGLFCERDFNETIYFSIRKLWRQWIGSAKFYNNRNQSGLSVISNSWRNRFTHYIQWLTCLHTCKIHWQTWPLFYVEVARQLDHRSLGGVLASVGVVGNPAKRCDTVKIYDHSKGCTIFVHEQSIIGEHGTWCVMCLLRFMVVCKSVT